MTWVKETLPPRVRFRWLLMTIRLSASSLAGTARTEVAVGTVSEASMLRAIAAAAPPSTFTSEPPAGFTGAAVAESAGVGLVLGSAVWAGVDCWAGAGL